MKKLSGENEKFDALLRDRINSEEFELDERHWRHAEQLIAAKERKENVRRFAFWIFLGLLLAGAGYSILHSSIAPLDKEKSASKTAPALHYPQAGSGKNSEQTGGYITLPDTVNGLRSQSSVNSALYDNGSQKLPTGGINRAERPKLPGSINDVPATPAEALPGNFAAGSPSTRSTELVAEISRPVNNVLLSQANGKGLNFPPMAISPIPGIKIAHSENTVQLQLGAFLSRSYSNPEGPSGMALNPLAGVHLRRQFNARWSAGTGLLYLEKGKINTVKSFHSLFYTGEFGRRTEDIQIRAIKLQYLQIPVTFQYHFGQPHQELAAGVSYGRLLTALSEVETNDQVTGEPGTTGTIRKSGYVNGFEKHDLALVLGYSRRIARNWAIDLRLYGGLTDITRNDYFNNGPADRNLGMQLSLKYRLW